MHPWHDTYVDETQIGAAFLVWACDRTPGSRVAVDSGSRIVEAGS